MSYIDELIFDHSMGFSPMLNHQSSFLVKIYRRVCIIGISSYTMYIAIHGNAGRGNTFIHNIPYIDESIYEFIRNITTMHEISDSEKIYSKIKQQIMDKLNEDPTYQELSQLNIVHEVQQLKIKNEKTKQKYKTKLSEMKSSIQQLQEDMKILFAKTAELQKENKLLKQEKETLSITTKIGQSLVDEDLLNCM
jgi:hypothetical protein